MSQTKHDLPAHTRAAVIELLNAWLADRIARMHQAKQAHGPGKGPSCIVLHTLFDTERRRAGRLPHGLVAPGQD